MKKQVIAAVKLMRWHQPIGFYLVLAPTLWALVLASAGFPDPLLVGVFIAGAFIMRSAGCVINDFWDVKTDKLVGRTQERPLASGTLSRGFALVLFCLLIGIAVILLMFLNSLSRWVALFALSGTVFYPLAKRFFFMPQLVLSFVFGMGVLMAYAAQIGRLPMEAFILYGINGLWILAYDIVYAVCDKEGDMLAKMKSGALFLGNYTGATIALLQLCLVCALLVFGAWQALGVSYFIFIFASSMLFPYHWKLTAGYTKPDACLVSFRGNHYFGWSVLLAFWSGVIFP